jgi:hypothetical protein
MIIYDDFQHVNFIYIFHKISFHYFEDYLMTKLTWRVRYVIYLSIKELVCQVTMGEGLKKFGMHFTCD